MKQKTPYQIFGIECGKGWKSLYEPLITLCEKHGVEVVQIKEKCGGLRFYWSGRAPEIVRKAIDEAERRSFKTCEQCGAPGVVVRGSWIKTLCAEHAATRETP